MPSIPKVEPRLLPGGTPDPAFGSNGIALHPVAQGTRSEVSGSNYDFGLLRLWS